MKMRDFLTVVIAVRLIIFVATVALMHFGVFEPELLKDVLQIIIA